MIDGTAWRGKGTGFTTLAHSDCAFRRAGGRSLRSYRRATCDPRPDRNGTKQSVDRASPPDLSTFQHRQQWRIVDRQRQVDPPPAAAGLVAGEDELRGAQGPGGGELGLASLLQGVDQVQDALGDAFGG